MSTRYQDLKFLTTAKSAIERQESDIPNAHSLSKERWPAFDKGLFHCKKSTENVRSSQSITVVSVVQDDAVSSTASVLRTSAK